MAPRQTLRTDPGALIYPTASVNTRVPSSTSEQLDPPLEHLKFYFILKYFQIIFVLLKLLKIANLMTHRTLHALM